MNFTVRDESALVVYLDTGGNPNTADPFTMQQIMDLFNSSENCIHTWKRLFEQLSENTTAFNQLRLELL
jgi:hypothetical protein